MKIEMHCHSKFSDGENSTEEILNYSKQNGIQILSINNLLVTIGSDNHKIGKRG